MTLLDSFAIGINQSDFIVGKEQSTGTKIEAQKQFCQRFRGYAIKAHSDSTKENTLLLILLASDLGRTHMLTICINDDRVDKSLPNLEAESIVKERPS